MLRRLLAYGVSLHLLANLLCTSVFLYASARNYPGGDALAHLQFVHRYLRNKPVSVHIDTTSAETGISQFLHLYPSWEYNKTEGLGVKERQRFDYLLVGVGGSENREAVAGQFAATHTEHFAVEAFQRIAWRRTTLKNVPLLSKLTFIQPELLFKPKVVVLKRKNQ